jgi:hypothetical protein
MKMKMKMRVKVKKIIILKSILEMSLRKIWKIMRKMKGLLLLVDRKMRNIRKN